MPKGEPAAVFRIPPCPSTNNLTVPRRDGKGRARTSVYAAWQRAAGIAIMAAGPRPHISGPVVVLIEAPFNRLRDIDNIKPVLDILGPATARRPHGMGIIDDDRWVDDLRIVRVSGDMMTVSIWPL